MAEQRMVPVELLELAEYAIRELAEEVRDLRNHAHAAYQPTCAELRAIIDGPGVEPVAKFVKDDYGDYPIISWRSNYIARIGDVFYLAAPSAPAQAVPDGSTQP